MGLCRVHAPNRAKWVDNKVIELFSQHKWSSMVKSVVKSAPMLSPNVEIDIISTDRCCTIHNGYHGSKGVESDFFFVYVNFSYLHICFLFYDFIMGVL